MDSAHRTRPCRALVKIARMINVLAMTTSILMCCSHLEHAKRCILSMVSLTKDNNWWMLILMLFFTNSDKRGQYTNGRERRASCHRARSRRRMDASTTNAHRKRNRRRIRSYIVYRKHFICVGLMTNWPAIQAQIWWLFSFPFFSYSPFLKWCGCGWSYLCE